MNQSINAYEVDPTKNSKANNTEIDMNLFSNIDFGPLKQYLDDDNVTDISYSNKGQLWLKSLDKGVYRVDNPGIDDALMEKIAFQCANIMGKVFNMASPFLDSESSELRMNFVHDSIARNGIAAVFRKTPAKIRLKKEKIIEDKYITENIHDFLIECVQGHCNIIVSGETGSGKTELVKYLASHTKNNEKIVTIEDTLELHLDRIFPERDIVSMKTNNVASYSDVLVTCMRQNPKWILLSEVRSAEAVMAVRNSISSGHNILSTIHADKACNIPFRLYSLLESNQEVEQFMTTIYRYVQLGVHVRARYDKDTGKFMREVCEVSEFYVTEENKPEYNTIYRKNIDGTVVTKTPSKYLKQYLESQGVIFDPTKYLGQDSEEKPFSEDTKEENVESNVSQVVENTVNTNPTVETVTTTNTVVDANNIIKPTVENVVNTTVEPTVGQNATTPQIINPSLEEVKVEPTFSQIDVNSINNNPTNQIVEQIVNTPAPTVNQNGVIVDATQYLDPIVNNVNNMEVL